MTSSVSTADSAASRSTNAAEQCPANIGRRERRKRRIAGVVGLAVSALVTLLLLLEGAPRSWRVFLILPWWTACLGIFQARARVCVALASRGLRNLEGQQEAQPAEELAAVRRQARLVHLRAALAALALTLLSLAWP